MLECELCNYFKSEKAETRKKDHFCEITGFKFRKHLEEYDIDYPCINGKYDMEKLNKIKPKDTIKMNVILSEEWKYQYRRKHMNSLKRTTL